MASDAFTTYRIPLCPFARAGREDRGPYGELLVRKVAKGSPQSASTQKIRRAPSTPRRIARRRRSRTTRERHPSARACLWRSVSLDFDVTKESRRADRRKCALPE